MLASSSTTYSKYYMELDSESKKRYEEKVKLVGEDRYCRMESSSSTCSGIEWTEWPDVLFADIYNYLMLTPSAYI